MREILFRGKKKDSGEWVCGDLIQLHEEASYWYILPEGISSEMYEDEPYHFRQNDVMCSVALAKIIPETVGQFTGLTDKNGTKIFEGDVLKVWYSSAEIKGFFENLEVYYDEFYAQYMAGYRDLYEVAENSEVIGNIYDNPELLGE